MESASGMKKAIKHLPELKQNELRKIVEAIHATCNDIEKIILFGSYARGDYKEKKDLREGRKSGHISDYDILVVSTSTISLQELQFPLNCFCSQGLNYRLLEQKFKCLLLIQSKIF